MNKLLSLNNEFIIFFIIENLVIFVFLIIYRYSRNHGGVFDRRVEERRLRFNGTNWLQKGRRLTDIGYNTVTSSLENQVVFEVDVDRRMLERRTLTDRRIV